MLRLGGLMMLMLFVAQGRPAPGKVNSTYDKSANFQTLKTYSWVQGQPAFDPSVDKTIVAAVDSEMSALGFTKAASADVTIRYLAVRSTSIDLEKLAAIEKSGGDKAGADYTVGRLVIAMQDAKTSKQLWAADCVERLNPAVAERDATIKQVATRMFETYPTKLEKKK
jgi:Domain of unknown function (DUF4136)